MHNFIFGEMIPDKVPILRGILLFGIFFATIETEKGLIAENLYFGSAFTVLIWSVAVVVWLITEAMVLINKNSEFFSKNNRKDTFVKCRKNLVILVALLGLLLAGIFLVLN